MYLKVSEGYINLDKCSAITTEGNLINFNYSGSSVTVVNFEDAETAKYIYNKLWKYICTNKSISTDEILSGEVE